MRRPHQPPTPFLLLCLLGSLLLVWTGSLTDAFAPNTASLRLNSLSVRSDSIGKNAVLFRSTTRPQAATASAAPAFSSAVSRRTTTRSSSTSSQLNAASTVAVAAITGAVSGGLFAGGLHAVAGPDHLAALLPRCCGQRWYKAGRVGALWGMGHGLSATLLGVCAFALKNTFQRNSAVRAAFSTASHVTEIAVGLSLVLIGVMGIKEAREWQEEEEEATPPVVVQAKSLSSAAVQVVDSPPPKEQNRAVLLNGILHGFSWDGAPSLAPAIAVATWSGNLAFLSAYAVGTMTAMAVVTTLVGEGTRRAGELFQRPDIPQKLSYASSLVAIAIGVVWCGLGLAR